MVIPGQRESVARKGKSAVPAVRSPNHPSDAAMGAMAFPTIQRTYGNRAVGVALRAQRAQIQRGFEDDEEPKQGNQGEQGKGEQGKEGQQEIQGQQGFVVNPMHVALLMAMFRAMNQQNRGRQGNQGGMGGQGGQKPLMLTDRPWEQIEKERDPAYQMMFGEDKSGLPGSKGKMSGRIEIPGLGETMQQIEAEREAERKRKLEEKRARRREARQQHKEGRAKARETFIKSLQARVDTILSKKGGDDFSVKLNKYKQKWIDNPQIAPSYDDPMQQNKANNALNAIETRAQKHKRELKLRERLLEKQTRYLGYVDKITELRGLTSSDVVNKNKTFFDSGPAVGTVLDNKLAALATAKTNATVRARALRAAADTLENAPSTKDVLTPALAVETDPLDVGIDAVPTDHTAAEAARRTVVDFSNQKTKKEDLLEAWKVDPARRLKQHIINWIGPRNFPTGRVTKTEMLATMQAKLDEQHNPPKAVWLRDELGYKQVVRGDGSKLYIREGGPVTLTKNGASKAFDTHISVFANTVAAGNLPITSPVATVRDTLFNSSPNPMRASHVTLEIYKHGQWPPPTNRNPNPHTYRGGDFLEKRLADKSDTDNTTLNDVEQDMRQEMTTELARVDLKVQDVINAKGSDLWPVL